MMRRKTDAEVIAAALCDDLHLGRLCTQALQLNGEPSPAACRSYLGWSEADLGSSRIKQRSARAERQKWPRRLGYGNGSTDLGILV